MEVSHLRYFFYVAQTASFRAAAELAHVSAPAMTKAIHKLEEELDVRLFERTTRRVILTEEGTALFQRAREVMNQVDGIRRDLDELGTTVSGELRIGAMEVFSVRVLPQAISALVTSYPQVVPLCYEMHPALIERHLAEGLLDVGFTIGRASSKDVRSELIGTSAGRIVCGRRHPLYSKRRIAKTDLARYPFAAPRFFQREYLPSLDQYPDGTHPRIVGATIELLQMGVELVLGGCYLGCFPEVSVEHHLASGELRALSGIKDLPMFELQAVTRRGAKPKRSAALLIAELKSKLRGN